MFGRKKNKNMIKINGRTINVSGNNIRIANNKVYVDGKLVDDMDCPKIKIVVEGTVEHLETEYDVEIQGNCGNVTCDILTVNGNVNGDIDANCINVSGDVYGNVDVVSMNIDGDIHGNVDAETISKD
jgi:cytoskeletal protein CcmA (bactofilin family)